MEIIADADKKALDTYLAKEFSQKMLNSDSFGPEQNVMIKDKDESQWMKTEISKVDEPEKVKKDEDMTNLDQDEGPAFND